jgi:hypothetical protein
MKSRKTIKHMKNTQEEKSAHGKKNKVKLESPEKKSDQLSNLKTINRGESYSFGHTLIHYLIEEGCSSLREGRSYCTKASEVLGYS